MSLNNMPDCIYGKVFDETEKLLEEYGKCKLTILGSYCNKYFSHSMIDLKKQTIIHINYMDKVSLVSCIPKEWKRLLII